MGVVFDIQKFCLNDGPGIRTVVFLKGCPLKCLWCHNPESNSRERQMYIERNKCTNCGRCAASCKNGVHKIIDGKHVIDYKKCALDAACIQACPNGALGVYGKEMSIEAIIQEVKKDLDYYETSGGGVTISGGEPMAQSAFTISLAKELKMEGLHVCIETSGFSSASNFQKIIPYVDMFLFDYKATGDELHKKLTGVEQKPIIDNMKMIIAQNGNVRLRCPIIPGYNLSDEHLQAIADLSRTGVSSVDIIPYHDMGRGKALGIGSDMYLRDVKTPEQDMVDSWMDKIREFGGININQG